MNPSLGSAKKCKKKITPNLVWEKQKKCKKCKEKAKKSKKK
jgi:hypothetical protein